MPCFDFECVNEKCDHTETDVILSVEEYGKKEMFCPVCGDRVRQTLYPSRFRLIGTAWAGDSYSGQLTKEHNDAKEEHDYHRKHEEANNRREGPIPFA
jgi:hypothetical protein